jgi:hypothetical protein
MAEKRSEFRPNLNNFGVSRDDPGWIYIFKNGDLLKIGKTNDPARRVREAKTWLPEIEIIAVRPFWNVSSIERTIHEGCAPFWHAGEWFRFESQEDYEFFIEGFSEFYEDDRDMNSVDFIYWWNSSGFAEFSIERRSQNISLKRWKKARGYP